jgi:predicted CXXCH cytochrome family protein
MGEDIPKRSPLKAGETAPWDDHPFCERTHPLRKYLGSTFFFIACSLVLVGTTAVDGCRIPNNAQGLYVGTATCLACHDGRTGPDKREFLESPHALIACEECHGPGYAHFRVGGTFGLFIRRLDGQPFTETVNLCARCHEEEAAGYRGTRHFREREASCITCHDIHRSGAMRFSTPNGTPLTVSEYTRVCQGCHETIAAEFSTSRHAQLEVAGCGACHNPHTPTLFTASPTDNRLCQQCHASFLLGLGTEAALQAHIGEFHPIDPAGTGSGRCIGCHMPPVRENEADGDKEEETHGSHTFETIPPIVSNEDIAAGTPPRANSCAGVNGCHDPSSPGSGTPYDVNDPATNAALQTYYERIGQIIYAQ